MQIGVLSDTHGFIDERIIHHFSSCDEIWHAGDIGSLKVTDELSKITKLRAVFGNIDGQEIRKSFPEKLCFQVHEVKILLTHIAIISGRYSKDVSNSITEFKPGILVCGHSHILKVKYNNELQHLYINPGSAGVYGFHKVRTLLRFKIEGEKIFDMEVVELGPRVSIK